MLMASTPRMMCESLDMCGVEKFLCVPDNADGTDTLNETLMTIQATVAGFYPDVYRLDVCDG